MSIKSNSATFTKLFAAGPAGTPRRLASGFRWTEGPVYIPARRCFLFSDVHDNCTWTIPASSCSAVLSASRDGGEVGETGCDKSLARLELFPSHHQNGHCMDAEGCLVACSQGLRRLERQVQMTEDRNNLQNREQQQGKEKESEAGKKDRDWEQRQQQQQQQKDLFIPPETTATGTPGDWETVVGRFESRRLNSPNDVCLAADGSLWFTDPSYGLSKEGEGYGSGPSGEEKLMELQGQWVFRAAATSRKSAGAEKWSVTAPIRDRVRPNGIVFMRDGTLLVADTGDAKTHRYRVRRAIKDSKGNVGAENKEGGGKSEEMTVEYLGVHFTVSPGKTDGLRVDEFGHIWASAEDGVHVLSEDGQDELGRLLLPHRTSNLCFGGEDGKTLFMTVSTEVWAVETTVRGLDVKNIART